MRAGEVSDTGEMHGKRRRGTPKTSYSGNVAKWMGGSMEEIMRNLALNRENWCEMLHVRLIIIPGGTKKTKNVAILRNVSRSHDVSKT